MMLENSLSVGVAVFYQHLVLRSADIHSYYALKPIIHGRPDSIMLIKAPPSRFARRRHNFIIISGAAAETGPLTWAAVPKRVHCR